MKKYYMPMLSFLLLGCAHLSEYPHTVQFPYAGELLKNIQSTPVGRMPASAKLDVKEEKSPRRVYFSSLYYQYLVLGNYLERKNNVEFCPQFHHDKVNTDTFNFPKVTVYKKDHVGAEGVEYFPELVFQGKFSLKKYHKELKAEIEQLCEYGVSDNFFKFDNLITHYARKKSFHQSASAMESVLKIPIFANYYLLKMIEAPNEFNLSVPMESEFIQMSETHWFDEYVRVASKERSKYVRNQLVKR